MSGVVAAGYAACRIDVVGTRGSVLASGRSSGTGIYFIDVPAAPSGGVGSVRASECAYEDEATGRTVRDAEMSAYFVFPAGAEKTVHVTPYTEVVARHVDATVAERAGRLRGAPSSSEPLPTDISEAEDRLSSALSGGMIDFAADEPILPVDARSATADAPSREYGLLLAALSGAGEREAVLVSFGPDGFDEEGVLKPEGKELLIAGSATFELTGRNVSGRPTPLSVASATADGRRAGEAPLIAELPVFEAVAGEPLTIDLSAHLSDADGEMSDLRARAWGLPEGLRLEGARIIGMPTTPGRSWALLAVFDDDGNGAVAWAQIAVAADDEEPDEPDQPNASPIAAIAASATSGTAPLTVSFDGTGSSDPDGTVASYAWTFGDDGAAAIASPSHVFTTPGRYTVRLRVLDDDGADGEATTTITVSAPVDPNPDPEVPNTKPSAVISANATAGVAPATFSLDASASTDADGTVAAYAWNLGDGRTATGRQASVTYADPGAYTVALTVTDDDGATDTATLRLTATEPPNRAPTARATAPVTEAAAPFVAAFDGRASSDPDGTVVSYAWDFGDGASGSGPRPSHTYDEAGTYAVALTVTDDDGATASTGLAITATEPPNAGPKARITAPSVAQTDEAVAFDGSASSDPDGTVESYAWSFGDGAAATGPAPSHAYASPGTYAVTLTVTDDDGATARTTASITVTEPPNEPPVASFTSDEDGGAAPLTVTFDGRGSTDPDGEIVSYAWTFSNGAANRRETAVASTTWNQPGSYNVVLTVTDDDGETARASRRFTVTAPPAPKIVLPVKVFGTTSAEAAVAFDLPSPAGIDTLYVQCHRCAYRDDSVDHGRGAKASVRLNGGDWTELTNDTVTPLPHEAAYGGLNGGLHTVRFTVPIAGAVDGRNEIAFRFNQTDGYTNGYRVLDFNLRKGGQDMLLASAFEEDDPNDWTPPSIKPGDIAAGEALWRGSVPLVESPLHAEMLRASCSSCHAQDGRDLKYFAYSNESIVTRSKFHGLSQKQGEDIASYIRTLDVDVPEKGRPWNPPYQPGPGLDDRPADEWSAGAGLEWVLETDAEMLPYLLPNGTSKAELAKVFDVDDTMNMREMPIAMQFPDWNAWLPEIHPMDNWGEHFETTEISMGQPMARHYADLRALIENNSLNAILSDGRLKKELNDFASVTAHLGSQTQRFVDTGREKRQSDGEGVGRSMVHWSAVKQWEVQQELGLDGLARDPGLYGEEWGEDRSWVSLRRNVFDLAPHRLAPNLKNFDYHSVLVGKTHSTMWYQSQLTINAGAREGYALGPVDWNYQPAHVTGLSSQAGGPKHPLRYFASHAKMYQYMTNGVLPGTKKRNGQLGSTFGLRQAGHWRYLPDLDLFEGMDPDLHAALLGSLLEMKMDSVNDHDLADWPRGDGKDNDLDINLPEGGVPDAWERKDFSPGCHRNEYLNCYYNAVPYFRDAGVDDATLERVIVWGEEAWPTADWDALRE